MKKVCGALLWGFSLLSVAQMIQSAKIAMYLDKASGLGYFPNYFHYINPLEVVCIIIAILIGCIIFFSSVD